MMATKKPGRQAIGSGIRGGHKGKLAVISVRSVIFATVAAAVFMIGAAHFAFVRQNQNAATEEGLSFVATTNAAFRSPTEDDQSSPRSHDANINTSFRIQKNNLDSIHNADRKLENPDPATGRTERTVVGGAKHKIVEGGHIHQTSHEGEKYHIVFSTDCSAYQHWQSYVLFYSALKVGQEGFVTRIASGCSDKDGKAELEWHNKHIRGPMSDKFGLHLTPHFSSVKKDGEVVGDYEFFNKPFGLRHWMEHGEGMGINTNTGAMKNEDMIIVLLDPDQILLRPFTDDFSNDDEVLIHNSRKENRKFKVEHGAPFAQLYGLGARWQKFNLDVIAGKDSPAKEVSSQYANRHYPAGPPYLATARDMYQIAMKWTETVPKVHAEYPHLLAEMYAYCIAAADKKLPHQIVDSLMVSATGMNGEGWSLVDRVPAEEVCEYASNLDHKVHALPNVMHLCQRYMLGKHFFGKRRLPKDFFTCESPMLIEVPGDIALKYDYRIPPPPHKPPGEKKPVSKKIVKRETFMLCAVTTALNEASEFFKRHACEGVKGTDYSKSMDLWNVPLS
uniref:Uncharacterized protein n=1 Tax=Odontella aurita TaxID=265563 RepID=A0A7S4ITT2_9STRA|mmetsp:Transcript_30226/g.89972  ORF Transcript_30226/g.89972 Transcript_30226/m.89972 type:complete len:560 (+) Transcript_30226:229-1908(+)